MNKRYDSGEFELERDNYKSRRAHEDSLYSTDLSDQLSNLNRETQRENRKVVNFLEELKNWKGKNKGDYITIKKSDYDNLQKRLEELEKELANRPQQVPEVQNNSFELNELQDELNYKNDILKNRDNEIKDLKNKLQKLQFENSTYEKTPNVDNLKDKLADYRKKFFAEKKKNDELNREKDNLQDQINMMDREIKAKGE